MTLPISHDETRWMLREAGASQVTFTLASGRRLKVWAIFTRSSELEAAGGELRIMAPQPSLRAVETDVAPVRADNAVTVGAADYLVTDIQPDGEGEAVILLRSA